MPDYRLIDTAGSAIGIVADGRPKIAEGEAASLVASLVFDA